MHILIIIVFIVFFTDAYQLFEIAGYGVNLVDFAFLAVIILFFKKMFWDGEELKFHLHPGLLFMLLLIFSAMLSGITPLIKGDTVQMIQFLKTSIHFIFLLLFTLICATYKIEAKTWTSAAQTWLIISLLINGFGVYQIFARAYDLPLAWLQFTNVSLTGRFSDDIESVKQLSLHYGDFYRATSIFSEPSALASFNVLIQALIIVPFIQRTKPFFRSKILSIVIFAVSLITLFLCFSMTGFVGMAMIICGILLFHWSKRLMPFFYILIASLIIIIATDSLVQSVAGTSVVDLFSKRLRGIFSEKQGIEGESIGVRLYSAKVGLEIWERHCLTGAGIGLTAYNNRKGVAFGDFSFIAVMAEMGLLGLIAFIGIFISLFITSGKYLLMRKARDDLPEDLKTWIGLLFFIMLHLFLINFISGNNLVSFVLWQIIAIVFSNINSVQKTMGKKVVAIKFLKKPLKISLNQGILHYLNFQNKIK
ncbi:MAG: hypothetical protein V1779_11340 [bacterium]